MIGDLILEVGAGTGWSTVTLELMKRNMVALDINPSILKKIRDLSRRLDAEVEVVCADMMNMPFKEKAFQLIFSQGVLEHFDNISISKTVKEQIRLGHYVIADIPTNKAKRHAGAYGNERWLTWKNWKKLIINANAQVHLLYGSSPSLFAYLLPFWLWKLIGYRFSSNLGIVFSERDSTMLNHVGGLKERLVD